jgi:hypothetical protein
VQVVTPFGEQIWNGKPVLSVTLPAGTLWNEDSSGCAPGEELLVRFSLKRPQRSLWLCLTQAERPGLGRGRLMEIDLD